MQPANTITWVLLVEDGRAMVVDSRVAVHRLVAGPDDTTHNEENDKTRV